MDPINPWLDPVEVRRLAERLIRPTRGPAIQNLPDAGFDDRFEGFAGITGITSAPCTPPAAATPTSPPPSPPSPLPQPPVSTVTARGPFLERILRFRSWMIREFDTRGLFILDRDGSVIFDDGAHGKIHFLARSLAQASRKPGGSAGNVHVKVGAEAILEVIPLDTPYGWMVLGAVVPNALSPAAIAIVIDALLQVASPPVA